MFDFHFSIIRASDCSAALIYLHHIDWAVIWSGQGVKDQALDA